MTKERVSCHDCMAACCQDVVVYLTPDEANTLRGCGTRLMPAKDGLSPDNQEIVDEMEDVIICVPGLGNLKFTNEEGAANPFFLDGLCGFAQEEGSWISCSEHGNLEQQPSICREAISPGDEQCLHIRNERGFE